jgi:DDE superfamily endonuclease
VPVELNLRVERRLPDQAGVAAYYAVSEALASAAKHAQASAVQVELGAEGDRSHGPPLCTNWVAPRSSVIWDNLNTHRSPKMRAFTEAREDWLTVVQLPGDAPDLNAAEGAWSAMKSGQLGKLRGMLRFCGILTLALNTSDAPGHRMFGTAMVDAVGPAQLVGWSEVGPWMVRQIYAVCSPTALTQPEPRAATGLTPMLPETYSLAR